MEVGLETEQGIVVDDRLLGRVEGARSGPLLICVGGIHGNEPAGIHALHRVLPRLAERTADLSGTFIALAGNIAALAKGCRFVDRDLNRAWTDERLADLRTDAKEPATVEDREQLELLAAFEDACAGAPRPVYALDLHTTSGPGGVFSAFSDSLPMRRFAEAFPVPMIFGLEEQVDGTLLNLLSEHGLVAITVETGQHDEPAAVDRAEAAVWTALVAAGLLPEASAPEAAAARSRLATDSSHLPRALEMRYRRPMTDGDGFVMEPGYANFDPVREGQVIARDRDGPVEVGETSRLLMPLYQEQGEDGYFLVRAFSPFWMHLSVLLRGLRLAGIAHWLPGVRRQTASADELIVDRRIARFFAKQLFHLLGYRRIEEAGEELVMKRRRFIPIEVRTNGDLRSEPGMDGRAAAAD